MHTPLLSSFTEGRKRTSNFGLNSPKNSPLKFRQPMSFCNFQKHPAKRSKGE
jgi:hypothetical protein